MNMVALLRGINVGGHRRVPMLALRTLAADSGFTAIQTYVNSGNLVFQSEKATAFQAASLLEAAIEKQFGFAVDVVVRTAAQWNKYAATNPFPDAAAERPDALLLGLCQGKCARNAHDTLSQYAQDADRVMVVGDALWLDLGGGVARSKLTSARLDKAAGAPVTTRNWRTVMSLKKMLRVTH